MKKYIILALSISTLTSCFALDLTRYQNVQFIQTIPVLQPTIVEIINLNKLGNYVVVDDKSEPVPQQIQIVKNTKIIPPLQAEGCTNICKNASSLTDGQAETTFDFPLISGGIQKGKIKITYAKPLETDSVVFQTTNDSYMPTVFTLMIDGKRILNTMQGGSARFPKMMAQSIDIEFEYSQPIRFTEVGVGLNKEENVTSSVRFVYQLKMKYSLYTDSPTGREYVPATDINLFSKNKEADIVLDEVHKNPLYKERDTDTDGVVDGIDNCPLQANADQKDSNGNGIGDVCDDYDYDGIPTYMDNCPEVANPDQKDTDKDGIGDACDTEESRVTEKYPWMPWIVFVGVLGAVSAMGYEVIRMKKAKEGKVG